MLAKIAEMQGPDRGMAERLHALVKDTAPDLTPKTWYGMPAYAKDGKVVCFFKARRSSKRATRRSGFSDKANLDDGAMWPTNFTLKELTPDAEVVSALLDCAAQLGAFARERR